MKLAKAVSDAARARELEVMEQRPKKRFGPKARLYRAAEAVSKWLPQIRPSPDQARPGAAAVKPAKPHLVYIQEVFYA